MTEIDPASRAVLDAIVRRESRSFLSYIADSFPWTTAAGGPALAALNKLIRQEADAVTSLGRYLVRRRVTPPFIGSYPASFTSWNFVALSHMLPRLLEAEKRSIAELQADLPKIQDVPARQEVERLLGVKKMTLAGLESITPSPPAKASA